MERYILVHRYKERSTPTEELYVPRFTDSDVGNPTSYLCTTKGILHITALSVQSGFLQGAC